jgi:hypothetical protein
MFEGRLLHGTGVNKTETPRRMFVGNSLKPNFRQQELWALSLAEDVLAAASPKVSAAPRRPRRRVHSSLF